jgi:hypothetical protein
MNTEHIKTKRTVNELHDAAESINAYTAEFGSVLIWKRRN